MLDFITKKISSKIIFALFLLMLISSSIIVYSTTTKVTKDSIANAKENLEMLIKVVISLNDIDVKAAAA